MRAKGLTLDEIVARLTLPKTTIWYWISDLPIGPTERQSEARLRASLANKQRAQQLRDEAYQQGRLEFLELCSDPTFRDFVCMYIGEGYKRNRNTVSIANSDLSVILVSDRWIRRLTNRKIVYSVQHHADQDLGELSRFWGSELGVEPSEIRFQRKSNSGQLHGRTWRCVHGVLTIRTCDTYLRARLQAWIECVQEQWLDSARTGRSSAW